MGPYLYLISSLQKIISKKEGPYRCRFSFHGVYQGHYLRGIWLNPRDMQIEVGEEYLVLVKGHFVRHGELYGELLKQRLVDESFLL